MHFPDGQGCQTFSVNTYWPFIFVLFRIQFVYKCVCVRGCHEARKEPMRMEEIVRGEETATEYPLLEERREIVRSGISDPQEPDKGQEDRAR